MIRNEPTVDQSLILLNWQFNQEHINRFMNESKTLHYHGRNIEVRPLPNGDYVDEKGTVYPAMLFDPGYCGLSPFETGKMDPFWKAACKPHDVAFNKMKAGYADTTQGNFGTFADFTKNVGIGMLQGAFAVAAGIPYIVIGGIGGMLRWWMLD